MKFFHLADLHIGKSVNSVSMLDEQRHIIRQILGYIQTERPDAVLIAGDVYDRPVPGIEAVGVFDDFLTALAREGVPVLLIAGNHDSPERLSYASRLLEDRQLYLYGAFDGTLHRVTLSDAHGDVHFWLLPHIKPATVRGLFPDREIDSYGDALAAALSTADIDHSARNVLVTHQFFTKPGVSPVRSESELDPVGGLDAIDAGLVEGFDYVALGHLHGAQRVGAEHIRYAGSPLKYSFSEVAHEKSVTLVELGEKGDLTVCTRPLTPIHDMREIRGELAALTGDEATAAGDREDYLRVVLTDEEEIIDAMGKVRGVYPNVMSLDIQNTRTGIDISAIHAGTEKVAELSPYDLFGEFFLEVNGSVMSEEQAEIVRDILEEGGIQ